MTDTATNAGDAFDRERIDELIDVLEIDGAREIIDECVVEVTVLCDDLAVAAENKNAGELKSIAHKLKGAAASGGASLLAGAAEALENALNSGAQSDDHINAVKEALQKTVEAAKTIG